MDKLLKMIVAMQVRVAEIGEKDRGATATEYAMLIAFIVIMLVGALTIFGTAVQDFFTSIAGTIGDWASGTF
jgi:pilus assembly protein Flp/PilA